MSLRVSTNPVPGAPGTSVPELDGGSSAALRIETPGPVVRAPAFERLGDGVVGGALPAAALRAGLRAEDQQAGKKSGEPEEGDPPRVTGRLSRDAAKSRRRGRGDVGPSGRTGNSTCVRIRRRGRPDDGRGIGLRANLGARPGHRVSVVLRVWPCPSMCRCSWLTTLKVVGTLGQLVGSPSESVNVTPLRASWPVLVIVT